MNLTQALSKLLILADELRENGMLGKYAHRRIVDEITQIQSEYNQTKKPPETMM